MYKSLNDALLDLRSRNDLLIISHEVDPYLEMAEIQRQVYADQGPAILFKKIKGCKYRAVSNLFGTVPRAEYLLRDSLPRIKHLMNCRSNPVNAITNPWKSLKMLPLLAKALPIRLPKSQLKKFEQIKITDLPFIHCWPKDGGAFITLPQVFSQLTSSIFTGNLGMYRVQMTGNNYVPNKEVGMHYQIHRTIGKHHAEAILRGENLKVSIFVGGPPAHTLAAVMPLPENISEVLFAGLLANRNFRYAKTKNKNIVSLDADFIICGEIAGSETKPEGPFGDHLGYYSLTHDFPVMKVESVYAKKDAVWPFTVVGRPPQEDTSFGHIIHEIVGPAVSKELPGVKALHAVDEAGVHPLLLAVGSERYTPYAESQPMEILTQANAILGFGQCSLAKYLMIANEKDLPQPLDIGDTQGFIEHILERVDFSRDLHFQTKTTIDTLDYSGEGLNRGSKVVIAGAGKPIRSLGREIPKINLPKIFSDLRVVSKGILAIKGPKFTNYDQSDPQLEHFCELLNAQKDALKGWALIVITDDSDFLSESFTNFLWVTFTRSNPSHDIHGVGSFTEKKHWGCHSSLVIDARAKPHHAPMLELTDSIKKQSTEIIKLSR